MKFSIPAILSIVFAAQAVTCGCPPRNPDGFKAQDELREFAVDAISEIFPYQKGWEIGYNKHISPSVKATFNDTWYDVDGLKGFFANRAFPILHDAFKGTFEYQLTGVTAVPYLGKVRGGWIFVTGWEFGYRWGDPNLPWNVTNGLHAVVDEDENCELKFTEWREASNLGFI